MRAALQPWDPTHLPAQLGPAPLRTAADRREMWWCRPRSPFKREPSSAALAQDSSKELKSCRTPHRVGQRKACWGEFSCFRGGRAEPSRAGPAAPWMLTVWTLDPVPHHPEQFPEGPPQIRGPEGLKEGASV